MEKPESQPTPQETQIELPGLEEHKTSVYETHVGIKHPEFIQPNKLNPQVDSDEDTKEVIAVNPDDDDNPGTSNVISSHPDDTENRKEKAQEYVRQSLGKH